MKSPKRSISMSTRTRHQPPLSHQRSLLTPVRSQSNSADSHSHNNGVVWAKPFDRFRITGGGAAGDIFRRFKICKSEEEDFMVHWCRNHITLGIFTRDDGGVLEFRVSSSDLSDLTEMGIGRHDLCPEAGTHWTHVYDEQGVSWLTQFRYADYGGESPKALDVLGEDVAKVGRIGRYGPSGLTPSDFYRRMQAKALVKKVSVLDDMPAEQ